MSVILLYKNVQIDFNLFYCYLLACMHVNDEEEVIKCIQREYRQKTVYTNIFKARIK